MTENPTFLDDLNVELGRIVAPIRDAVQNPRKLAALLDAIGTNTNSAGGDSLVAALGAVAVLADRIDQLAGQSSPSFAAAAAVLDASRATFAALRALDGPDGPAAAIEGLGVDLAQLLLQIYLWNWHPLAYRLAILATVIQPADAAPSRPPVIQDGLVVRKPPRLDRFRFDRLSVLLSDPAGALRAEYGTSLATAADANAMADKLFPRVLNVLRQLGVVCRYGFDPADAPLLGDSAPFVDHALIVYAADMLVGAAAEAGAVFTLSSADRGDLGLVVNPFGTLTETWLANGWSIEGDLSADVRAFAVGRHGLTLLASPGTAEIRASLSATLAPPPSGPAYVVGSPTGMRLEIGGAHVGVQTTLSEAVQSLALAVDVVKSALVIASSDGDGFLADILPADGLRADFDLGLTWSSETGLTLRGSADLEATVPVGLSVAGVSLTSVHLGLRATDGQVEAEVSASLSAAIGPVRAVLDRVGMTGAVTFPPTGGNLGVADLDLGFKGPSGIGLSIDAQGVLTGGGFLFHDEAQGLYAGAMQLSLHEAITLKAFGLIATRLPDGSRGYSLIVFITAEDFRPIPLGLGFTLLGIGGMVGVHRTFDQDVLREGLKSGLLATLLFPPDPVGNAPTLIRNLASAFPARRGSYLLGLLVEIGWFTPTLVHLDLALILEFGARTRLLALGRISALLPSADNDLVRLNMEAMGVLDFDASTAAVDAVLVDSRLAQKFVITGSAALRAGFGSGPSFVLSVGGFNPHFAPPAGVPALARVGLALSSGDNPRLLCEAYFAITSNTLQFGARASLYAGAGSFSIDGDVGFDVLVQLAPLHFIAEFHAQLQLKYGSSTLFMVSLAGALDGPRPLVVSGKATFEIFWCDFSVQFNTTLVDGEPPPDPLAVNVLTQLTQALVAPASWRTERQATETHGVALRSLPPASPGAPLVLDPLGQLLVMQQVVPLNTARDIDTFGGAPVAGVRHFALTAAFTVTPTKSLVSVARQAAFAPAQFFVMSEDDKLAAPSFEAMDAGGVFGDAQLVFDPHQVVPAPLEYVSVAITLAGSSPPDPVAAAPYTLIVSQLQAFTRSGAAARAPVRRVGRARFRNDAVKGAACLTPPQWTIVPTGEGPAAPVDPAVRTWSDYQGVLHALNRAGAHWQLVPPYELDV